MELKKEYWSHSDCEKFEKYLTTLSKGQEKSAWEKRIVNTNLPCICVQNIDLKRIIKEISAGNYLSFLNNWLWNNHSETLINGGLISKIKDFDTYKKYLLKYSASADNWATCDTLHFQIKSTNKQDFFELSASLLQSELLFQRRIGLRILMGLIEDNNYINEIIKIVTSLYDETEYYVNMMNAWLICEMFIKQREITLKLFQDNRNKNLLNSFTTNKAISKCRDSFRVSVEDKSLLLQYKEI